MAQQESVSPLSQSVVFHAEGVTKTYRMGEIQVRALTFTQVNSSFCWVPRAVANPHC
jgi:hypothetical protein